MVTIEPEEPGKLILSTDHILSVLDKHADSTAMLVLPGVQYYTGQLFEIEKITAHARKLGIFVVWDLAHAAGNVELKLHDWDVDAAAWCSYKYLNSGPGAIGGMFIHERNTRPDGDGKHPSRLAGWWANRKETRFDMKVDAAFEPREGAHGFQLSNPSVLDGTALLASLEVFHMADAKGGMEAIRRRSIRLTKFLAFAVLQMPDEVKRLFEVISPQDIASRGAQLSIRLEPGLLEHVMEELTRRGIFVDDRKPDVIRVAPAPLYNTFEDCYDFAVAFAEALLQAQSLRR